MSFSVDLWNGFEIINSAISIHQNTVKQVFHILTSYSSLLKQYYKGLENLYNETKQLDESEENKSPLEDPLNVFKYSIKEESEKIKNLYDNIIKNINELKQEYDKIESKITPYFKSNNKNKESFNGILKNLISKQEEYNKSCNQFCSYLIEDEANKIIKENNKNNNNKDIINNENNNKNNDLNIFDEQKKKCIK